MNHAKILLPLIGILSSGLLLAAQKIDTKDWKTFTTKDKTFSIKTPQGWVSSSADDENTKAAMEKIKQENPNIAKLIDEGGNQQYELYIVDSKSDALKGLNTMNLKSIPRSGLTPDLYPEVAKQIIAQAKLENSGWKELTLPVAKAVNYWGTLNIAIGDGKSISVKMFGYLFIKDENCYFCTMGTTPDRDATMKPIFDAMANSIVVK